jgi:hypothetical protein
MSRLFFDPPSHRPAPASRPDRRNPRARCALQLAAAPASSWPARLSWRSGAAIARRRREVVDLVLIVGQLVPTGTGGRQELIVRQLVPTGAGGP